MEQKKLKTFFVIAKGIIKYPFCKILKELKNMPWKHEYKKSVANNRLFWKSVKSLLSDKSRLIYRMNISEKCELLKTESETSETLNSFFSNIVKYLNILRYSEFDPVTENVADPIILAIQSICEKETFHFSEVNIEDIK